VSEYIVAPGAPFTAEQGRRYGKRLEHLERKHGVLSPNIVLDDAANPRSPLHDAFEWNDRKAAQLQRLERAADIIRMVRVVVRVSDEAQARPRAFMLVRNATPDEPAQYASISRVLNDKRLSGEVLKRLRADLAATRSRYESYFQLFTRLQPIGGALDEGVAIVDELLADEVSGEKTA
jgi:hypothetical protein